VSNGFKIFLAIAAVAAIALFAVVLLY